MKILMVAPYLTYESFEYHESKVLNETRLLAFNDEASRRKAYVKALKIILEEEGMEWEVWDAKAKVVEPVKPLISIDASEQEIEALRAKWADDVQAYELEVEDKKRFKLIADAFAEEDDELIDEALNALTLDEAMNFITESIQRAECVQRCYELDLEGPF